MLHLEPGPSNRTLVILFECAANSNCHHNQNIPFVATARLVQHDVSDDDDDNSPDFERRIQQVVETQLRRNTVVAAVVDTGTDANGQPSRSKEQGARKICGMTIWTFTILVVAIISLLVYSHLLQAFDIKAYTLLTLDLVASQ